MRRRPIWCGRRLLAAFFMLAALILGRLCITPADAASFVVDSSGAAPGSYPTIAAALAVADDGDSVEVLSGTSGIYAETFTMSKAVHLFTTAAATIDAAGAGTAVTVTSPAVAGATPTIEGFKITGGAGPPGLVAGGVHVSPGAEAHIKSNFLIGNTGSGAGAISVVGASALISGNTISENTNTAAFAETSAAILVHRADFGDPASTQSTVSVRGNTIAGNVSSFGANGLFLAGSTIASSTAIVADNLFVGNGGGSGGAVNGFSVMTIYGEGKILNNVITGNTASDTIYFGPSTGYHDAAEVVAPGRTFSGVEFIHNTVTGNAGAFGGLVFEGEEVVGDGITPKVLVANSIVAGNRKAAGTVAGPVDLHHVEMPGGAPPASVEFLYSQLGVGLSSFSSAISPADAGTLIPMPPGPIDPVTGLPSAYIGQFVDFESADFLPFPPFSRFPTTAGDFHLVPPPGLPTPFGTASYDLALLASLLTDLDGHGRFAGGTDMGALQHVPEPASILLAALIGAPGGLSVFRRGHFSREGARYAHHRGRHARVGPAAPLAT